MPRRVGDFRGLTQPSRARLLRAIQREPGRRASELAGECDIPLNTARDHLRVLEDEGLIRGETRPGGGRGRPPLVFHPVREAESNGAASERVAGARRRGALLRATTGAVDGRLDDASVAQIDVLYEHLEDAGLEPVVDEAALTFELTPCPYLDLLDADRALVCSMHARLAGDVLRQVDGPLALGRLDPFVTEDRCRLALARAAR
ncbi:helix-turn-helix domain-containing protein [Agromyces sp. NPDC056523]|uniref:helix-turn-helix domain-containing protein n=1 Tax=Agromyces sp. NPDC056523 TaxID=3345850 RepID=UPI00366D45E1